VLTFVEELAIPTGPHPNPCAAGYVHWRPLLVIDRDLDCVGTLIAEISKVVQKQFEFVVDWESVFQP